MVALSGWAQGGADLSHPHFHFPGGPASLHCPQDTSGGFHKELAAGTEVTMSLGQVFWPLCVDIISMRWARSLYGLLPRS